MSASVYAMPGLTRSPSPNSQQSRLRPLSVSFLMLDARSIVSYQYSYVYGVPGVVRTVNGHLPAFDPFPQKKMEGALICSALGKAAI